MKTITTCLKQLARSRYDVDIEPELTRPDEQFGDFATNVAMQLAGRTRRNPREIASELAEALKQELDGQVANVTVAGPGFINITLSDESLLESVRNPIPTAAPTGRTVLVEYSDPNPFKPLHAGHLYTTLVGDIVANLQERAGNKVIRLNYGGDVGLHVAKSMWAIVRHLGGEKPELLEDIAEHERPAWLGQRYVEGNSTYEDDEQSKQEIVDCNRRVYAVHTENDHDSPFAQIYWTCREWSYRYFSILYKELGVHPFDRFIPESEVTQLGISTVREQLTKGVYSESEGAVIFEGEKFGLHTRVFINSAGLPTYEAKDVGLLLTKWNDYHFDESVIITANEQAQYMEVMVKSVEQFDPEPAKRSRHLTHGFVKLKGGVKMSSRKGNVVTALEIVAAAREAGKETDTNPSDDTILAAIKYALAKNRISGDIAYDPKESISLEGNSGPYLQYAHARARSVLAKVTTWEAGNTLETAERSFARKISEYPDAVHRSVDELMPHHICTYLYELAQDFNSFYEHNRVVGDPREGMRALLVKTYADILKDGLRLLGISAPERM